MSRTTVVMRNMAGKGIYSLITTLHVIYRQKVSEKGAADHTNLYN